MFSGPPLPKRPILLSPNKGCPTFAFRAKVGGHAAKPTRANAAIPGPSERVVRCAHVGSCREDANAALPE